MKEKEESSGDKRRGDVSVPDATRAKVWRQEAGPLPSKPRVHSIVPRGHPPVFCCGYVSGSTPQALEVWEISFQHKPAMVLLLEVSNPLVSGSRLILPQPRSGFVTLQTLR